MGNLCLYAAEIVKNKCNVVHVHARKADRWVLVDLYSFLTFHEIC